MPTAPWRTRAYIKSYAPLSTDAFLVGDCTIVSRPELVAANVPKEVYIVDVILEGFTDQDAEEANIIGIDNLEDFLGFMAQLGLTP